MSRYGFIVDAFEFEFIFGTVCSRILENLSVLGDIGVDLQNMYRYIQLLSTCRLPYSFASPARGNYCYCDCRMPRCLESRFLRGHLQCLVSRDRQLLLSMTACRQFF